MTHIGEIVAIGAFAFLALAVILPEPKPVEFVSAEEKADARQDPIDESTNQSVPEKQPSAEIAIDKHLELTIDPKLLELQRLMTRQQTRVERIEKRVDALEQRRAGGDGQ